MLQKQTVLCGRYNCAPQTYDERKSHILSCYQTADEAEVVFFFVLKIVCPQKCVRFNLYLFGLFKKNANSLIIRSFDKIILIIVCLFTEHVLQDTLLTRSRLGKHKAGHTL